MREPQNIKEVAALEPDYLGFIFYKKSKRYVGDDFKLDLPRHIKRVCVSVNQDLEELEKIGKKHEFDVFQLHGDEDEVYVKTVYSWGKKVVKAFGVDEMFDFDKIEVYKPYVDYFLFDTKSKEYGGTGKHFDWKLLEKYDQEIPLFLSGGIGINDIEELKNIPESWNIHAIDVNSKFEIEPAFKNVEQLKQFKEELEIINELK